MVATERGPKTKLEQGWLDPFLDEWQTGTGREREVREPATGRHLLTIRESTPEDVRRVAAAAANAQPAWAEASYQERAAVLRRAADIYEAHRPEFGTWTQRETGAHQGVARAGSMQSRCAVGEVAQGRAKDREGLVEPPLL